MKYKKGDRLVITQDNPYSADLQRGNVVVVIRRNDFHGYEVRLVDGYTTWDIGEDCLERVESLPIGTQLTFGELCQSSK